MDTGRHLERPTADCLLADRISPPGCSNPGTLLQNRASLREARDAPRGAAVGWRAASGLTRRPAWRPRWLARNTGGQLLRSEEHTSELQSQFHLVCRLLLEKKKKK